MITVTNLTISIVGTTSYCQATAGINYTVNIWCPSPDRFPGEQGCGRLIKAYGLSGDVSNLSSLIAQATTLKNVSIKCPYCQNKFNPLEVYT